MLRDVQCSRISYPQCSQWRCRLGQQYQQPPPPHCVPTDVVVVRITPEIFARTTNHDDSSLCSGMKVHAAVAVFVDVVVDVASLSPNTRGIATICGRCFCCFVPMSIVSFCVCVVSLTSELHLDRLSAPTTACRCHFCQAHQTHPSITGPHGIRDMLESNACSLDHKKCLNLTLDNLHARKLSFNILSIFIRFRRLYC